MEIGHRHLRFRSREDRARTTAELRLQICQVVVLQQFKCIFGEGFQAPCPI